MTTTIDHIIIAVPDLTEASNDYSALLGRAPSWRGAHPDYGTANTLFKLDNTYIELLAPQALHRNCTLALATSTYPTPPRRSRQPGKIAHARLIKWDIPPRSRIGQEGNSQSACAGLGRSE